MHMVRVVLAVLWLGCALCWMVGCDDDEENTITGPTAPIYPVPSHPDSVIEGLEASYNDDERNAEARGEDYATLFPSASHDSLSFIFYFQSIDVPPGESPSWGVDSEVQAHRNMFGAQDAGDIFMLELNIVRLDPVELENPEPGQENWVEILGTNVNLRLMFNPQDGILIDGGQAMFLLAPADDRWYMTEWTDLPHPEPQGSDSVPASWGSIKFRYLN